MISFINILFNLRNGLILHIQIPSRNKTQKIDLFYERPFILQSLMVQFFLCNVTSHLTEQTYISFNRHCVSTDHHG